MYVYIHQILDAAYSIMLRPMMSGHTVAATKGTILFCSFAQMQLDVSKSGTKKNFDKEKKYEKIIYNDNSKKKKHRFTWNPNDPLFRLEFGPSFGGFLSTKNSFQVMLP